LGQSGFKAFRSRKNKKREIGVLQVGSPPVYVSLKKTGEAGVLA